MDEIKTHPKSDAETPFKEEVMDKLLESLDKHAIGIDTTDEVHKSKKLILEILERDFVSTTLNQRILNKLLEMLNKDG